MACTTNNSSLLPTGNNGVPGTPGINGINGTNGTNGVTVLYSSTTATTNNTAVLASMQSYTLPANQMTTNGDAIEITCCFSKNVTTASTSGVYLYIGGTITHVKQAFFNIVAGVKEFSFRARATRISSTTLFMTFETINSDGSYFKLSGGSSFFETGISVNDMTLFSNLIDVKGVASGAGDILSANNMMVIYFKK